MIIKTVRTTRPNTEVNFYEFSLDFVSYRLENYINTKKLKIENSLSEDGLTKISTFIFLDQATQNQYDKDPIISKELKNRNIYNRSQGITANAKTISTYQEVA